MLDQASDEFMNELTSVSVLNSSDFNSYNLIMKCKELGVDIKLKNRLGYAKDDLYNL